MGYGADVILLLACTVASSNPTGFDDAMPDWGLQSDMPVDSSLQRDDHVSFHHLKAGHDSQLANGMLEGVLMPLDGLQGLEVTWEDEGSNTARWGPHTLAGETVARQLLIRWNEDDSREWWVQEDIGDGWVDVFEGTVEAGSVEGDAAGTVSAYFGDMYADDNPGPEAGTYTADYADRDGRVTVYGEFDGVVTPQGTHTRVLWYDLDGSGAGALDYTFIDTEVVAGGGDEEVIGRARWTPEGGGRVDLEIISGDSDGFLTECWGQQFEVVHSSSDWLETDIGTVDACPPGLQEADYNATH